MGRKKQASAPTRREFFKFAGLGAGAAAVAGAASGAARAAQEVKPGRRDAGYRETEHVKKYYETARF